VQKRLELIWRVMTVVWRFVIFEVVRLERVVQFIWHRGDKRANASFPKQPHRRLGIPQMLDRLQRDDRIELAIPRLVFNLSADEQRAFEVLFSPLDGFL